MQKGDTLEGRCLVFLWNGQAVLQNVIAVIKTQGLLEASRDFLAGRDQSINNSLPLGLKA